MSTKPQAPGPNPNPTKQARSRKAANPEPTSAGRAGSAGGVVLSKEAAKKSTTPKPTPSQAKDTKPQDLKQDAPKKKPRKLNKDPTPAPPLAKATTIPNEAAELEALKSRVRGLEAKVEDLYKTAPSTTSPRSPRRRGKGRKNSSATTTATLGTLSQKKEPQTQPQEDEEGEEEEEEEEEELIRLEDELESARQDLALYTPRPRTHRTSSQDTQEIPRERPSVSDRQVTLTGSYRIPLPPTLNPSDIATIQSGVAAAQNVARSFMEQRRAGRTVQTDAGPGNSGNGNAQADGFGSEDGKKSWGDWIGGYSVAISRAVRSVEHEAAMEAQGQSARPRTGSGRKRTGDSGLAGPAKSTGF